MTNTSNNTNDSQKASQNAPSTNTTSEPMSKDTPNLDSLDEILKPPFAFLLGAKTSDIEPNSLTQQLIDEAIKAILQTYIKKADVLEAIGEDEPDVEDEVTSLFYATRNGLRKEFKNKLGIDNE